MCTDRYGSGTVMIGAVVMYLSQVSYADTHHNYITTTATLYRMTLPV